MSTPKIDAPATKAVDAPKNAVAKDEKPATKTATKTRSKAAALASGGVKKPAKKAVAKPIAGASSAPATKSKTKPKTKATEAREKKPTARAPADTAKPAATTKPAAKAKRAKKEKVVRDSFTMPKADYAKIASLKQKCLDNGIRVKKSELLRAALAVLDAAPEKRIVAAIKALETVKTGRPANA